MSEKSGNGWSAADRLPLRPLVVNGIAFSPGIRDDDDVETVLRYVVEQYAARVEPLVSPGCWGFFYRPNRNDPTSLSNHSSGTAIDVNAPQHPNGVPVSNTFTLRQRGTIRDILAEVDGAVRWGGDYIHTVDAMHFEINTDAAHLHTVAEKLRDDMPLTDADIAKIAKQILDGETVDLRKDDGPTKKISIRNALQRMLNPDES